MNSVINVGYFNDYCCNINKTEVYRSWHVYINYRSNKLVWQGTEERKKSLKVGQAFYRLRSYWSCHFTSQGS